jgi:ribosomal-protein-alanine N-acetyltransferase
MQHDSASQSPARCFKPCVLLPMAWADCSRVAELEHAAHRHPWSFGHFQDSLMQHHPAYCLWQDSTLLGFWVGMVVVDELHLLALTVAHHAHRQGNGRRLLQHCMNYAQQQSMQSMQSLWLEVAANNQGAIALYQSLGWQAVGRRKQYYPAVAGVRDDAILMSYPLMPNTGA